MGQSTIRQKKGILERLASNLTYIPQLTTNSKSRRRGATSQLHVIFGAASFDAAGVRVRCTIYAAASTRKLIKMISGFGSVESGIGPGLE